MSTELEQMTAAGGTITIGGRTLLLKQMTLGDYGQLRAWLKQRLPRPFAVVAEALNDLEPLRKLNPEAYESSRKELLLSAMQDSKAGDGVGATPETVEASLNGPDGVAMLLWLCSRKEQPDVTFEMVSKWLESEDINSIKAKLDDVTIFNREEDEDPLADPLNPPPLKAKARGKKSR